MVSTKRIATGVGVAAGATAVTAVVGAKVAAARLRARPADDTVLVPIDAPRITVPTRDGAELSVVRVGSGPPIVLSHGVTLSIRTWVTQLTSLVAAGFEVVAYDQRGHGGSTMGDGGFSVRGLGADLADVMCGLDLADAVIVGHSMGGIAVQSMLLDEPDAAERTAGAVLLSTLPRAPMGSQATRAKVRVERMTERAPDTTRAWQHPDLGLLMARLGFGVDPNPSHVELVRQMMLECPISTRIDAPRSLIGADFVDRLDLVDKPTLVIGGTHDLLTPLFHARLMVESIRGAVLEVFEGAGHMLMLEAGPRLDDLVIGFAHATQS